jgi:hypothetical protein
MVSWLFPLKQEPSETGGLDPRCRRDDVLNRHGRMRGTRHNTLM